MDYNDFGARVRKQRMQLGWTQERLAREMGVSTSFIGHIERGSRKASMETLVALAKCMKISTDHLLAGSLQTEAAAMPDPDERAKLNALLHDLQNCLQSWNGNDKQP